MLFDTHTHLCESKYDNDRAQIIEDFEKNNVGRIVEVGDGMAESIASAELAKHNDLIYASVGVHPYNSREFTSEDIDILRDLVKNNDKVVGIGECGLDYHAGHDSYKDAQKECFKLQIDLALELNLPLIVHVRDAYDDCLEILKEKYEILGQSRNDGTTPSAFGIHPSAGGELGVIHCFSGTREFMEEACGMGFYVAFGGAMTYSNADNIKEAAKAAPADRILIETDCPYLVPAGIDDSRNQPKYVKKSAEVLAGIRGVSLAEIEDITWDNAHRLFRI